MKFSITNLLLSLADSLGLEQVTRGQHRDGVRHSLHDPALTGHPRVLGPSPGEGPAAEGVPVEPGVAGDYTDHVMF